ncbi:MAG: YciI family protein [Chthoniobacter sp.]|uniref:YciI family protein n=1 Tax=Chthoniobacter sp. TaxID=2510640 RepID=UPI0032AE2EE4
MNSASTKSEYLLLFRGTDWHRSLTSGEIKEVMIAWMAWSDRLVDEGRSKARRSLSGTGKIISGKGGKVSDGPYAEAKEAVAGYFLLEVDDLEEAIEIARECPTLAHGATVEVRPMPARCLASQLAAAPVEAIADFMVGGDPSVLRAAMAENTF